MKKIEFTTENPLFFALNEFPKPATSNLPNWYKKAPRFKSNLHESNLLTDYVKLGTQENPMHMTYKLCVPFIDAMTIGYTLKLPASIMVTQHKNTDNQLIPKIDWNIQTDLVDVQDPNVAPNFIFPSGFSPYLFRWLNLWKIKTPRNYSLIVTHPIARNDLPFYTLTGVIDTDKHINPVVLPFCLKDGYEGLIEAGTPIAQIIPIKRDFWNSSIKLLEPNNGTEKIKKLFYRTYKRLYWTKKIYR